MRNKISEKKAKTKEQSKSEAPVFAFQTKPYYKEYSLEEFKALHLNGNNTF